MASGRVIGGYYLHAVVAPRIGSTLVLQAGLKFRKLNNKEIAAWEEVPTDATGNPVSAVGQAVARAALPGRFGKAAAEAVGATFGALGPTHHAHIDWSDGKQSLVRLPDSLFKHFALMVDEKRVGSAALELAHQTAEAGAEKPTVTEQAFSLASELVDRIPFPGARTPAAPESAPEAGTDITDQLTKLAALRDAGILTEDEFTTKKTELLTRL